jgi:hypothetical protein
MALARAGRRSQTPASRTALALFVSVGLTLGVTPAAPAAGPPQIEASWVTAVAATSANLHARVNPEGLASALRFEYLTQAAYEANIAASEEGFAGATRSPATGGTPLGSGTSATEVARQLSGLSLATTYRYRAVVTSSAAPGGVPGPEHTFTTQQGAGAGLLADGRGWEMVSPVDKNGGAIQGPGQNFGGDVLQAAAQGGAVTYSSASSFGQGAQGAPAASQYLGGRESGGWSVGNLTAPQRSEAEPLPGAGVPYRIFSEDLSKALLRGGGHCLSPGVGCADPSPPPPSSGAPSGYQDYYLTDSAGGADRALITAANAPSLAVSAEAFEVSLAGATPDLSQVVLSTCAKLTPQAVEVPLEEGEGCDPSAQNLYRWSEGQLSLLNFLPGEGLGTPGARLAAPSGAISADGQRAYFLDGEDSPIYVREASGQTKLLPETSGGGSAFQAASADGATAYFTKAAHLYRYNAASNTTTDLTPGGEVQGVLGASEAGSYLYYESAAGLELYHEGANTLIAAGGAQASNWPPATGTARVSGDGTHLLFSSTAALTGFDNKDAGTGAPDSELFLYGAAAKALACVSCNPTNGRPVGSSSVPGAIANGTGAGATQTYKPRVLSAGAGRVFFDSADALALQDTNNRPDVYEWEAPGVGSCTQPSAPNAGCVSLISSGRDPEASEFIDASASGADAFFLTAASLLASDPGSVDLYDAREGGGFALAPSPIPCEADACQPLPPEPEDPTPGTLVAGTGNPAPHFTKVREPHKPKGHHKGHKKKGGHHRKAGHK